MFVPDRARRCVLFLGIKERGVFKPRATAFVIEIEDLQHRWSYLVTAEHVVSGLLTGNYDIWIRINSKTVAPDELKIEPEQWCYHPNTEQAKVDVAIAPIVFDQDNDLSPVPIFGPHSVAANSDLIKETKIGVGDEVVVTGLFRSHYGQQRNVPITRVGNIAMLENEPVKTLYAGYIDAYLIEARSIGGLSGSPVFVNIPAIRIVDGKAIASEKPVYQLYLLGLMHGHFDVEDLNSDVVLEDEKDSSSGIHSGIGVVVPVEKIIETVMQPELARIRRRIVEEHRAKNAAL
jgi:hypothetical protein